MSRKRVAVFLLANDCLSSETEDAKLVEKNAGEILIIPSPDDPHRNIVAEHDNY